MPLSAADYRPRDAEHAVLYRVIAEHLEAFLETAKRHADGSPLPGFVEQEFRDFLTCGVLAHGFARLRCADCAVERLVPFSCKGRGFCPSCGGRRMTECAARLVDEVLPRVSLPYRLRYLLAWDHALARAVLGVFVRVLLGFQHHRARRYGIRDGRSGCVTVIQRFGGGLNLNIHFHTLLFDGVFCAKGEEGMLDFRPLPPPTDEEVGVVLARITARLQRLLERRGLESGGADLCQADPVVEESPALAGISSLRWALALDGHGRRPRRDPRDPGRRRGVARADGPGTAVGRVAGHQPRRCTQRVSAIRAPRTPRLVRSPLGPVPSGPLRDRNPLTGRCPRCIRGGRSHLSTSPGAAWRGRNVRNVREGAFMSLTLYDAATIAIKAIETAAKGGKVPSREDVATAVRMVKLPNGITGDIEFDAKGDRKKALYFVLQVANEDPGKWGDNKIVK